MAAAAREKFLAMQAEASKPSTPLPVKGASKPPTPLPPQGGAAAQAPAPAATTAPTTTTTAATASSDIPSSPTTSAAATSATSVPLDAALFGWKELKDDKGRAYFFNPKTKKTAWNLAKALKEEGVAVDPTTGGPLVVKETPASAAAKAATPAPTSNSVNVPPAAATASPTATSRAPTPLTTATTAAANATAPKPGGHTSSSSGVETPRPGGGFREFFDKQKNLTGGNNNNSNNSNNNTFASDVKGRAAQLAAGKKDNTNLNNSNNNSSAADNNNTNNNSNKNTNNKDHLSALLEQSRQLQEAFLREHKLMGGGGGGGRALASGYQDAAHPDAVLMDSTGAASAAMSALNDTYLLQNPDLRQHIMTRIEALVRTNRALAVQAKRLSTENDALVKAVAEANIKAHEVGLQLAEARVAGGGGGMGAAGAGGALTTMGAHSTGVSSLPHGNDADVGVTIGHLRETNRQLVQQVGELSALLARALADQSFVSALTANASHASAPQLQQQQQPDGASPPPRPQQHHPQAPAPSGNTVSYTGYERLFQPLLVGAGGTCSTSYGAGTGTGTGTGVVPVATATTVPMSGSPRTYRGSTSPHSNSHDHTAGSLPQYVPLWETNYGERNHHGTYASTPAGGADDYHSHVSESGPAGPAATTRRSSVSVQASDSQPYFPSGGDPNRQAQHVSSPYSPSPLQHSRGSQPQQHPQAYPLQHAPFRSGSAASSAALSSYGTGPHQQQGPVMYGGFIVRAPQAPQQQQQQQQHHQQTAQQQLRNISSGRGPSTGSYY